MKVGYRRVSTIDQNLDRQDLGDCERVFEEKVSGKNTDRSALQEMIAFVREGDEVIVFSIDRLARDLRDLQSIIQTLNDKGVTITFLSERLNFTGDKDDAFSRLQLQLMGAFAEFERNIIRKRQAEGIAKAKARGVYKGRKKKVDDAKIIYMKEQGKRVSDIAREMGVSRMTVYRALETTRMVGYGPLRTLVNQKRCCGCSPHSGRSLQLLNFSTAGGLGRGRHFRWRSLP